ncbi:MAG: response regulator transcription factor [Gemmataceae bacterium]|nr:response regulator transcription factor [Gemmataceae bacterium]
MHQEAPEVKVLVPSAYEGRSYLQQALQAGARGFVLQRAAPDDLAQAIRTAARGSVYLDPAFLGHVVDGLSGEHAPVGDGPAARLSEREAEVLKPIAQGFSNKQIAARLRISAKTVEAHKVRAMEKLGLRTRVDLVQYAHRHGWLERG